MITKEKLLFELINYSSIDKPLDAAYFFNKFKLPGEGLSDYSRRIAIIVREIQNDQIYYSLINNPFYLVFSSGNGYYIAKNREDAEKGLNFYSERAKSILALTGKIDKMINLAFPLEDPNQLKLL
ncbi:MAG: hypothetical protein IPH62_15450 [Ignavibacteriae bacterium]|nr:hypothetical protein [Ignavibacteriota bacterium]